MKTEMKSIKDILEKFNPKVDKYVSVEFQTFGIYLADKLGDSGRKALYIKYAKEIPRSILEEALRFVSDSKARSKGALFMWKLREMNVFEKYKVKMGPRKKTEAEKVRAALKKEAKAIKEKKPKKEKPPTLF